MHLASFSAAAVLFVAITANGCSSAKTNQPVKAAPDVAYANANAKPKDAATASIDVQPGGPADTVRAFYAKLREKKFREAIFMTNMRPAVEGLTDMELRDFAVDFEALAGEVPAEIEINGEIISGDTATVTVKLPDEDGEPRTQPIKLRREGNFWMILSVEPGDEIKIAAAGKNYFYELRIDTFQEEARKMLERVSKAQLAHSMQNNGEYTDIATLIGAGYLPDDIRTSESTGYDYVVTLSPDRKRFFATATPAVYGKTGKLSFLLEPDAKGSGRVTSKDTGGKPLKN
jgi:hypothetical protein